MWPEETVGHHKENAVIKELWLMSKKHGFGRIGQLAQQIEDIWRNSEKAAEYEKMRQDHLKLMEEARKNLADEFDDESDTAN